VYSSPSIFRMIKLMRMRWVGECSMNGGCKGYWWESQKERGH
jgi:hypothetical protein